ncbi:four helix bundle protein [Desulfobacterales bacterium HSG16]|nr:four helix bundle protein [Desulfobacterales bacterium HSG16]
MAKYEHLPIYQKTYNFLIFSENIVKNFSRYHKYTNGTDLRNTARKAVKIIIRTNNSKIKTPLLEELRVTLEELKFIIRVCKEVKAFHNFKSFETAINQVTDVSRQAEGWLKHVRKLENGQNPSSEHRYR